MTRNLRNMKAGNLKFNCLLLFLTIFTFKSIYAEEKINLNVLQPTFEEGTRDRRENYERTI